VSGGNRGIGREVCRQLVERASSTKEGAPSSSLADRLACVLYSLT
jgi:NAD(P)-dependent dehydrogenase (short-subunit alcohol dehydrogenase family)